MARVEKLFHWQDLTLVLYYKVSFVLFDIFDRAQRLDKSSIEFYRVRRSTVRKEGEGRGEVKIDIPRVTKAREWNVFSRFNLNTRVVDPRQLSATVRINISCSYGRRSCLNADSFCLVVKNNRYPGFDVSLSVWRIELEEIVFCPPEAFISCPWMKLPFPPSPLPIRLDLMREFFFRK